MGFVSIHCSFSGIHCEVFNSGVREKRFKEKYSWISCIVVLKDGSVTTKAKHDGYGRMITDDKEYKVSDPSIEDYEEVEGIIILEKLYQEFKNHPSFKRLPEDFNLYDALVNFKWKFPPSPIDKYIGVQELVIVSPKIYDKFSNPCKDGGDDSWVYTDPEIETIDGMRNKRRIKDIIKRFYNNI
jgi:hypothetical protein